MSLTWLCACSSHNNGNKPAESTKAERNFIVEGNEQYAQGNYTEAEAAYRKAPTENPNSAMAQFNLASALLRQDPKMGKNAPAPVQPQQTDTTQQEQMSEQLQHAVEILKSLVESSTEPAVVSVAAYDWATFPTSSKTMVKPLNATRRRFGKIRNTTTQDTTCVWLN